MEYTITSKTPDKLEEKLAQYKKLTALREDLAERLGKAEAQKDSVSPKIFEKVRSEYNRKLENVRDQLSPIQSELDSAQKECQEELPRLEDEIRVLEDELAEAEFRFRVGEFAQTKLTEIQTRLNPDLAERTERHEYFDKRLQAIDAGVESVVHEEEIKPHEEEIKPTKSETKPAKDEAEPNKDEAPDSPEPADTADEEPTDDGNSSRVTLVSDDPLEALTDRPAGRTKHAGDEETTVDDQDEGTAHTDVIAEEEPPQTSFENPQEWIDELGDRKADDDLAPEKPADKKPAAFKQKQNEKDKDDPLSALADPSGDPDDDELEIELDEAASEPEEISVGFPNMVIITGPSSGKKIPLLPMTMSIGREHDNNIELKDPDVGRYHARILYDRGRFVLEDLESSNGTWLNGEKISEAALKNGDRIKIGEIVLAIDFD